MTMITRLFCTTALSAFTFASVASAQVTADDVWQNTRDAIATLGGDFSAAKARRYVVDHRHASGVSTAI